MKADAEMLDEYLKPRPFIHFQDNELVDQAAEVVQGLTTAADRAKALFYWVRDQIKYNPYSPAWLPEHYRPINILRRREGYCVQKAVLLTAMARSQGLPARLVFADIVNHRFSKKLAEIMGTNLFVYHGYVEMFIENDWVRATPAFDRQLCDQLDILPVEFDGRGHAVFHRLDRLGRLHIEYVKHHGVYTDLPFDELMAAWAEAYPQEMLNLLKTGSAHADSWLDK